MCAARTGRQAVSSSCRGPLLRLDLNLCHYDAPTPSSPQYAPLQPRLRPSAPHPPPLIVDLRRGTRTPESAPNLHTPVQDPGADPRARGPIQGATASLSRATGHKQQPPTTSLPAPRCLQLRFALTGLDRIDSAQLHY
jgi:hypothetical protein